MAVKVKEKLPDDGTGAVETKPETKPEKNDKQTSGKQEKPKGSATPNGDGSVRVELPPKQEKKTAKKGNGKNAKKAEENSKTNQPTARPRAGVLSPFHPPAEKKSRVKIFVWGDSGAGKTVLALQFPSPSVIDLDNGTDPYKKTFSFDVKKTVNIDEVKRLIEWLASNPHPYLTLVIDPITILWESAQKKWSDIFLARNTESKGHKGEYYDMQPKDWQALKADLKVIMRQILALDMNVVVTARSKPKYKQKGDDYMVHDGETFDGDKSLPYMFDTVLHLENDDGKRMVFCSKDRWNVFPTDKRVPLSYDKIKKYWSAMGIEAPAEPVMLPPEEEVVADGPKDLPVSEEQADKIYTLVEELGFTTEQILEALAARGVKKIAELTFDQAAGMLKSLEAVKLSRVSEQK